MLNKFKNFKIWEKVLKKSKTTIFAKYIGLDPLLPGRGKGGEIWLRSFHARRSHRPGPSKHQGAEGCLSLQRASWNPESSSCGFKTDLFLDLTCFGVSNPSKNEKPIKSSQCFPWTLFVKKDRSRSMEVTTWNAAAMPSIACMPAISGNVLWVVWKVHSWLWVKKKTPTGTAVFVPFSTCSFYA